MHTMIPSLPRLLRSLAPAALATLILAGAAGAQTGPAWSDEYDLPGLVGRIFATGEYQGELIVGGYNPLQGDGRDTYGHVARWDGTRWQPLGNGVSDSVRAITTFGGQLVIGGEFNHANGLYGVAGTWDVTNGVALWDGSEWQALGGGLDLSWSNPEIWSLVEYRGELYAGGLFDTADGQPLSGIARWDGSSWRPVGGSVTGSYYPAVYDLTVTSDDRLIAVGRFDGIGGVAANNIAAWDGSSWSPLGQGLQGNLSIVFAVKEFAGRIYATGNFPLAGGQSVRKFAAWDGSSWSPVGDGLPDWSIAVTGYDLEVFDGALYIGGNFMGVDGTQEWNSLPASRIARWDGTSYSSLGGVGGSDLATTVLAMTAIGDTLYVGGEFTRAGDPDTAGPGAIVSSDIIAYGPGGWHQLNEGHGFDAEVYTAVMWNGGVFAAGRFIEAGGAQASRVAWNDGTGWTNVGSTNGNVRGSIVFEGDVVITGEFTSVGGVTTGATARWDGTAWSALGTGAGGSCLATYQGELYAGGIGGVRRWNGSTWVALPGESFSYVTDMLEYDGKLYIGATNSGATMGVWDGTSVTHLAVRPNDDVEALHIHDGQLLVGGRFTGVGSMPARILATFDGSNWSTFGGDTLTGFAVMDFAHLDGDLYVAGDLLYGTPGGGDYVMRWSGSGFESLGAGLGGMPFVLVPDELNRALHVGGWFYDAGDMPSWCYARWDLDPSANASAWTDMGSAMGGPAGLPRLDGSGSLVADTPVSLQIADAPPSAPTALIVGFSVVELPLLGGTLVPAVDLLVDGLTTGPDGSLVLGGNWPTGVPAGFQLALQAWTVEPANPWGWAATNGVVATVP